MNWEVGKVLKSICKYKLKLGIKIDKLKKNSCNTQNDTYNSYQDKYNSIINLEY